MYSKTLQASKACGVFSWWGEGLVLGLCVEAGLVAPAAFLGDLLADYSCHHCADDGADDHPSRSCAVKAV